MTRKELSRAAALALMVSWSQSAFGQSEPGFPVESIPMEIGVGLPGGNPVDVAGFFPGQTGEAAFPIAQEFYERQGANPPRRLEAQLDFAQETFTLAIVPGGATGARNYDNAYLLFSSNGSGNHLLSLYRHAHYESDHPNTAATVEAILSKYGTPSAEEETRGSRTFEYGFLNGALKQDGSNPCRLLQEILGFQPRNGHNIDILRQMAFRAVQNNAANARDPQRRCDVYLRISLDDGWENGMTNPDIIGGMKFSLIDAGRYEYANNRDFAAQEELKALAVGERSQGSGAPKL